MKILVPVKRVVDYNVRIRVRADQSGVETDNVKMSMNPFDEIAVEQAIRLKEAGICEEIIAVSIGPEKAQETIRTALAMGADRGIYIAGEQMVEPLIVAKILQKIAEKENPEIIILGKQAIDDDSNQTAQMLSALLDWPQATFISHLEIDNGNFQAVREIDGGLMSVKGTLPAIFSVDLRLNEPRYASLPNIMEAKKKPIDTMTNDELGIDMTPLLSVVKVTEPPVRQAGVKVANIDELVSKLRDDAKVISV